MKLLTPKDKDQQQASQLATELLRSEEVSKESARLRQQLAQAEADFKQTLARNREQWANEELEHKQLVTIRSAEVQALEARREQALVPVLHLEQLAKDKLKQAEDFKKELDSKQEELDDLQERLEDQLDKVGSREADLTQKMGVLEAKERGVLLQAQQVQDGVKALNLRNTAFIAETQATLVKLDARKVELGLMESSLLAKDSVLKAKEAELLEWATNIKLASDEVEAKRKIIMQPVDKLLDEAKALKHQAQNTVFEAEIKYNEASKIRQQVLQKQKDWQEEVSKRQLALGNQELIVKDRLNKVQVDLSKITKREQAVIDLEAELLIKTDKFNEAQLTFNNEQDKANAGLDKKTEQLEHKQVKLEVTLATITKEKEAIESLKTEIKDERLRLEQDEKRHQAQLGLLQADKQKADTASVKAKEDLKALELARQDYAERQVETEQKLAQQALENKAKQKLLSDKDAKLIRQEKFLAGWNKRLKDERGVLDRAWKELERKKSISP